LKKFVLLATTVIPLVAAAAITRVWIGHYGRHGNSATDATLDHPSGQQTFQERPGPVQPYLSDWQVLGSIPWDGGIRGAQAMGDPDDAQRIGAVLRRPLFPSEPQVVAGTEELPPFAGGATRRVVHESNGEIRLHAIFPQFAHQAAVATTNVFSPQDTDAAILIESDDGVRAWLNGVEVAERVEPRRIQQFEDYFRVRLRKGNNRIVLKLVRGETRGGAWDGWSFAVGLRSLAGARDEKAARALVQEMTTPLLGADSMLGVDLTLHQDGQPIDLSVEDEMHRLVKEVRLAGGKRHQIGLETLPAGLYYSVVRQSASPEPVPFYKGNVASARQRFLSAAASLSANSISQANVEALEKRLEYLLQPTQSENQSHLWQAKISHLLAEAAEFENAVKDGRDPFRDVAGTHLRGIRSPIDGANQYYILHVPRDYQRGNGAIPLVVFQPYVFEKLRPFLESIPVAEISVLRVLGRIADELGMAFLWMDNRGNTVGNDLGEADMFAAIDQVGRDYAIDPERLYLFGSCVGGREALALAAKYPDRFAAVGTMSPVSAYAPYRPVLPTDRFGQLAYGQKTPLERLENLLHVPVYVVHGDQNRHNPLAESYKLRQVAMTKGLEFTLNVVPGATHLRFPVEPRDLIFRWFAGHRRVRNPDRVALTTSALRYGRAYWVAIDRISDAGAEAKIDAIYRDGTLAVQARNVAEFHLDARLLSEKTKRLTVITNGVTGFNGVLEGVPEIRVSVAPSPRNSSMHEKSVAVGGPVWDVFTSRFLVVLGTGGGQARAQAAQMDADRFVQSWRDRYHGVLERRSDRDITAEDLADQNLVIFGESDDGPLARLGRQMPFQARGDSLYGPGFRQRGPLGVQYVVPNPINRDRYVLVNSSPVAGLLPVDAAFLTIKGWYDYAVWRAGDSGEPLLEDIGMFDRTWSRLLSKGPGRSAESRKAARN
jgi:pimeloyl-ACP methyl ester carboxylesterase